MAIIFLVAIGLSVGSAVFFNAGEQNLEWSLAGVAFCVLVYHLVNFRARSRDLSRSARIAICVVLGIAALQVLPLPPFLIGLLSPTRAAILRETNAVLGPQTGWPTLSLVPSSTFRLCLCLLSYVLIFLTIRKISVRLREEQRLWIAAWPLIAIATAEGLLGALQAYAEGGSGIATGTYGNRDHYAGLLELILPFALLHAVAILQRDQNRHESAALPAIKACAILVCAAITLIGVILSLSRMGFLATLASLFVAGVIILGLRNARIKPPLKLTLWQTFLPVILVGAVTVLGFIFLPTDPLISRFSDLAKTEDISADTRAQIWREASALVHDFPLVGVGLGGFESAFMKYKLVAPMFTVDYAHNDYLQILIEFGIVAFIAGLIFFFDVISSAAREIVFASTPDERCIAVACLASFTAILLHSFVDFNMYRPANAMVLAWIAGLAATRLSRRDSAQLRVRAQSLITGARTETNFASETGPESQHEEEQGRPL